MKCLLSGYTVSISTFCKYATTGTSAVSLWSEQTIHFQHQILSIHWIYKSFLHRLNTAALSQLCNWMQMILVCRLGCISDAEPFKGALLCISSALLFIAAAAVLQDVNSKRRTGLSVKCDLLQAQPCQLWGTEVWPRRCLTSPAASGPNSQLHNTAYPEQCHLLNNRPKTKRKHISVQFVPTVWPHIWNSFDPDAQQRHSYVEHLREPRQIKTSKTTRQTSVCREAFCKR